MNTVTHFLIGLLVGSIFFGNDLFYIENIMLILIFSNAIDLDHLVAYKFRPKNHLRTFIQEPLAILLIGVPSGLVIAYFLGFDYFWAVICLYGAHVLSDYLCIFETWPLDPFNTKIVKEEGRGVVVTLEKYWLKRRSEFPHKINEACILIGMICLNFIILYFLFF